MNLGENIYNLRTGKNMSQGDLADALDVSRQSVSKWENNSAVPELEKLMKMSELFCVSLDELVGKEKPQAPEPVVQTVYVKSSMPGQKIAGIILLCDAILTLLLMAVFVDPLLGFFMAVPLTACGTICLVCEKNVWLKCCWAVYLPNWIYGTVFLVNTVAMNVAGLFQIGLLLSGVVLVIVTIRQMYTGKLLLSSGIRLLLTVLMVLMVLIHMLGLLPLPAVHLDDPFVSTDTSPVGEYVFSGTESVLPG